MCEEGIDTNRLKRGQMSDPTFGCSRLEPYSLNGRVCLLFSFIICENGGRLEMLTNRPIVFLAPPVWL